MAEERLKRNLDDAFDPGPDFPSHLWLSRTMALLEKEAPSPRRRKLLQRQPTWLLPLVASFLAVAVVAALVFAGQLLRTQSIVPANKTPQAVPGTLALPVLDQSFLSESDAAVLVDQSPVSQQGPGKLEITHDGGQTWIRTGIAALQVRITWLDSDHLFVAAKDLGTSIEMRMTADGGYHWHTIKAPGPVSQQTYIPYFLNPREGWIRSCSVPGCGQGSLSTIWHTFDSGAHWQQLGNALLWPGVLPIDLYFVDSKRGYMGAASADGAGRIVVTEDGGNTWRLVDLPQPPGGWFQPDAGPTNCGGGACAVLPHMFGRQGVVLLEEPPTHGERDWFTYTTSDAGLTWSNPQVVPAQLPQPLDMPWQAPLDPENWWIADPKGMLYRSNDGGSTWHSSRPTLPAGYSLAYVKPVSADVLWGIARGSVDQFVVRSSDRGTTWSVIKLLGA
jgi:photosystem II stability/assembly factor-like uncharacterized protein